MKFVDSKGKLFGVINIIDFLIIALVIVMISGFFYTRYGRNRVLETLVPQDIQVTFLVANVREPSIEAVTVGDKVVESRTNGYLGQVVSVTTEPADVVTQLPDGRFYEIASTKRMDMFVTIRGPGKVTDNSIVLGTQEVRIGAKVAIKTNMYAFESTVWAMNLEP